MAEAMELKAWARTRTGKGGARAARREGRIPGILYGDKRPANHRRRLSGDLPAAPHRPFPEHRLHARRGRHEDPGDPSRRAARSGARLPDPCRFPAPRQGCAGHRRGAGALPQRSGVPRHQARRHPERRAPRDRGALPGRRHPRAFRRRPDRASRSAMPCISRRSRCRRAWAHHHRARFHRGDHRRPRRGRGCHRRRRDRAVEPGAGGAAAPAEGAEDKEKRRRRRKKDRRRRRVASFSGASPHALLKPSTRMTR